MADSSVVIGRISVKVLPDTSEIYPDTRRAVEAAERRLPEIDVDVEPDTSRLYQKVRRAVSNAQRAAGDIDVKMNVDDRDLVNSLDKNKTLEMRVEADSRSIKKAIADIDKRLNAQNAFNFKVATDQESLRQLRHYLEEIKEDYDNTELDFEPTMDGANYRFTSARLAALARDRFVRYHPIIDQLAARKVATSLAALSGLRLLRSTFDRVWDLIKNLDKNIPLIGGITEAVMGLSAWLLAAASNTFALSRSLAQIAPIALLLPGILGGFAVGVGAYVAVLRDLNDEIPEIGNNLSDLQDDMSARFWERSASQVLGAWNEVFPVFRKGILNTTDALSTWTNAVANAFAERLPGSMPDMFDNLNKSIQISSKGARDFAQIIEILGRRGSAYLPRLANWTNDLANSFANWLDESERTGRLDEMLEHAIFEARELGRALGNLGGIFADLARAAERAGGSTMTDFADKLERIRDVTNSLDFQKQLTQALRASHDAMERISKTSGPRVTAFFENLVDIFNRGLPAVGNTIGTVIGSIAEALSTERFTEGFLRLLDGLEELANDIDDVASDIGDGIGAILSLAGDFAEAFGPLLAELLSLLARVAERVSPALGEVASILSARWLGVLEAIGPAVEEIAEALANLVLAAAEVPGLLEAIMIGFFAFRFLRPIVGIIRGFSRAMGRIFGPGGVLGRTGPIARLVGRGGLLGQLAGMLSKVFRIGPGPLAIVGAITTVIGLLVDAYNESERFQNALSDLWDGIRKAFEPVREALEPLKDALAELGDAILVAIEDIAEALGFDIDLTSFEDFSGALGDILGQITEELTPALVGLAEFLASGLASVILLYVIPAIESLTKIISVASEWISDVFIPAMQIATQASGDAWKKLQEVIDDVWQWIYEKVDGFLTWYNETFVPAIKTANEILGNIWDAMVEKVTSVVKVIQVIIFSWLNNLRTRWVQVWTSIHKFLVVIWNNIKSAVRTAMNVVKNIVSAGLTAIVKWFQQRWNAARAVVVNVLTTIRKVISNGINAAANAVSSALLRIVRFFINAWSQARSATASAWSQIVTTIAKFISNAISVISSLPGRAAAIIRGGVGSMVSAGASLISGLVSGIRSAASRVADAARSVVASAISAARKALAINSPSKVFIEIGEFVGAGFVEGLNSMTREVETASTKLSESSINAFPSRLRTAAAVDITDRVSEERDVYNVYGNVYGDGVVEDIVDGLDKKKRRRASTKMHV